MGRTAAILLARLIFAGAFNGMLVGFSAGKDELILNRDDTIEFWDVSGPKAVQRATSPG